MNYTKKLVWLSAIFLVTGLLAIFSLQKQHIQSSSELAFPQIAITDTSQIYQIEVVKNQSIIRLKKKEQQNWELNEKYKARKVLVEMLLFGLMKLEVKYPLAEEDIDLWKKNMKENGILLNVLIETKTISFFLMNNPTDPNSSVYADTDLKKFYIVHVPGVKGAISNLVTLKEADWRTKELFKSSLYSLRSLKLDYLAAKEESFEIAFSDKTFQISSMPNFDTLRLKKYLSLLPVLAADKYLDTQIDSVKQMIAEAKPYATFEIKDDIAERSELLNLYFSKDKKTLMAKVKTSGEWVSLNFQMWRFAIVPRKFFQQSKH